MNIFIMIAVAATSQEYACRKGKSHIKSKGENQLAADDFEAFFETSK